MRLRMQGTLYTDGIVNWGLDGSPVGSFWKQMSWNLKKNQMHMQVPDFSVNQVSIESNKM